MALYAIGDLHLSLKSNKPMDVFGPGWYNYVERIVEGFSTVKDDDVTVLCGDNSWGMSLEEAAEDLKFIDALPGKKILLKGNHDYWWNTAKKMYDFFEKEGITTLEILHNNCKVFNECALCGTRGWFYEEKGGSKVFRRELLRLEASLKAGGELEKICFLHYPPRQKGYECREIIELLEQYGVKRCFYGHLHGTGHALAEQGIRNGIEYRLISADYVRFIPQLILN